MKRRIISIFLTIAIFCSSILLTTVSAYSSNNSSKISSSDKTEINARQEANVPEAVRKHVDKNQQASFRKRLKNEEHDLCNAVFEKADGTKVLYSFEKPIKYISKQGEIRDKSTELTESNNEYRMLDNDVNVTFPQKISQGLTLYYGEYQIKIVPEDIDGNADRDEGKVEYCDNVNNIVLSYTPLLDGFKEDIILLENPDLSEITFRLYTNGLSLHQDGSVLALQSEVEHIASFSSLYIYDENGYSCVDNMTYTTIVDGQEYLLKIDLQKLFAQNPELQFPVTIDPSITVTPSNSGIEHAMVYSGYSTTTNLCTTLSETRHTIGYYDSTRKIGYELIRFPGLYQSDAFLTGGFISKVTFYQYYVPRTVTPTVTAYLYNGSWSPTTITYQNLSSTNTQIRNTVQFTSTTSSSPTLCSLDLTEYAWYWKQNSSSRAKGILLKNTNNTNSAYCAIFMADEVRSTQYYLYSPYVTLEYTTKKIMLDAGHRIGYNQSPVYTAYYEGTKMWDLHLYLKAELEKYGFEVGTTRTNEEKEVNVDLAIRGKSAAGYDMFLSLHSNARDDASVDHITVYYDIQNKNNASVFANQIGKVVMETMGVSEYVCKTRAYPGAENLNYYGVMRAAAETNCPLYYIIEHSYHTNEAAAIWLYSDANLKKLAVAEAKAIAQFYKAS